MQMQLFCIGMLGLAFMPGLPAKAPQTRDAQKSQGPSADAKVLVVMDERAQMEVLARYFGDKAKIESVIVDQKSMPDDWSGFTAVIG